jgi:hypothetical protein
VIEVQRSFSRKGIYSARKEKEGGSEAPFVAENKPPQKTLFLSFCIVGSIG